MAIMMVGTYFLSLTFLVSGCAKLVSIKQFERSLWELGADWTVVSAKLLAWTIPACEIVTAAIMLTDRLARAGGVIALILLATFSGYTQARAMLHKSSTCSCFGGLLPAQTGRSTIVRNGVLMVMCVRVAVSGAPDASGWQRMFGVLMAGSLLVAYFFVANFAAARRGAGTAVEM